MAVYVFVGTFRAVRRSSTGLTSASETSRVQLQSHLTTDKSESVVFSENRSETPGAETPLDELCRLRPCAHNLHPICMSHTLHDGGLCKRPLQ